MELCNKVKKWRKSIFVWFVNNVLVCVMDCILWVVLISDGSSGVHGDSIVVVTSVLVSSGIVFSGSSHVLGRSINVVQGIVVVVSTASEVDGVGPVSVFVGLGVAHGFVLELNSFGGGDKGSNCEEAEFHFELFVWFIFIIINFSLPYKDRKVVNYYGK